MSTIPQTFNDDVDDNPIPILEECQQRMMVDWDDRIKLQATWSLREKGWLLDCFEWKPTPQHGIGLFATQDISAGTVLRIGTKGKNLKFFTSANDIEDFCNGQGEQHYVSRLNYVKDYLWGYNTMADEQGYELPGRPKDSESFYFAMWVPGNGLNHNPIPNTVYCTLSGGIDQGIALVALTDIQKSHELVDDYCRHGSAPEWLQEFAKQKNITLNFANCNDFVTCNKRGQ